MGIVAGTRAAGPVSHVGLAALQAPRTGSAAGLPGSATHSPGPATTVAVALSQAAGEARSAAPAPALRAHPRRRIQPHSPQRVAFALLRHRFHWKGWQFKYLNSLWDAESGWDRYAANPYSGAYGIPQALPGSKMAAAGPGWRWNARTQILWGLRYIRACYRTPYWAWLHQHEDGWY
jgi:hypothetical protein